MSSMNLSGTYTIDHYDASGKHLSTYHGTNAIFKETFQNWTNSSLSGRENTTRVVSLDYHPKTLSSISTNTVPRYYNALFSDMKSVREYNQLQLRILTDQFTKDITTERSWAELELVHGDVLKQKNYSTADGTGIIVSSEFDEEYIHDDFYRLVYATTLKSKFYNSGSTPVNSRKLCISTNEYILSESDYSNTIGSGETLDVQYTVKHFVYIPKKIETTIDIPIFGIRKVTYEFLKVSPEYKSYVENNNPVRDHTRIYVQPYEYDEVRLISGVSVDLTGEQKNNYHPKMICPDWVNTSTITRHISPNLWMYHSSLPASEQNRVSNTTNRFRDLLLHPFEIVSSGASTTINGDQVLSYDDIPVYQILVNGFSSNKLTYWNWLITFDKPLTIQDTEYFKQASAIGLVQLSESTYLKDINYNVASIPFRKVYVPRSNSKNVTADQVQWLVDNGYWCNAPYGNSQDGYRGFEISIPLPQISVLFSIDEGNVSLENINQTVEDHQDYILSRYRV